MTYQLITPTGDVVLQTVLHNTCHTAGGYSRFRRTYNLLQQRVWWYGMRSATEAFIKACPTCAASRTSQDRTVKSNSIENHPDVCRSCQRLSINCVGPFPTSAAGNAHIILVVDHFTKYITGAAIPDKRPETIEQFLVESQFYSTGAPDVVLQDNGTEFKNELNAHILIALGYIPQHTTQQQIVK